jgi:hypothetical protein
MTAAFCDMHALNAADSKIASACRGAKILGRCIYFDEVALSSIHLRRGSVLGGA